MGNLQTSYDLFTNESEEEVDFLIMGPGLGDRLLTQATNESVDFNAEQRKDCIALIGPDRSEVVDVTDAQLLPTS